MDTCYQWMESPTGRLLLVADESGLRQLLFAEGRTPARPASSWKKVNRYLREPMRQMRAYFAGELEEFDLPLRPEGTDFQQRVWKALLKIPYGKTVSYGELARGLGNPAASRAVGLANGSNPIAIVIPCHRVIGSNGKLTGYGGGLENKQWLLEFERRQPRLGFDGQTERSVISYNRARGSK